MTKLEILEEKIRILVIQRNNLLEECCEYNKEDYEEDLKQLDAEIDEIDEIYGDGK